MNQKTRWNRKAVSYCFLFTLLLFAGSTLFQVSMFIFVNYPGLSGQFALLMFVSVLVLALAVVVLFLLLRLRTSVLKRHQKSRSP